MLISNKNRRNATAIAAVLLTAAFFLLSAHAENAVGISGVSAESALLLDANSGCVLYSKNEGARLPMASTTKIMTAIVAIESGDIDRVVKVSEKAVGVEGSSVGLKAGEELTLRDLLYAMLLESANDAAAAIACEISGDIPAFAGLMNAKAKQLGLENTHFENPHGLDGESHYTTASDLARLAAYCMENPQFAGIVSTRKATISNADSNVRWLVNHNKLLRMYDPAVGVKTGFTKKSGRCLVSAAERDGMKLIAVTLNAPDDWNDHMRMLDAGFESYEFITLARTGEASVTVPVVGGSADCVTVTNPVPACASLPRSHGEITRRIELPQFLYAPVASGQRIGRIIYEADGKTVAEVPLIACYSAERIQVRKNIFQKLFGK